MHGTVTLICLPLVAFERACSRKPAGYREAVLAVAELRVDEICLTKEAWAGLRLQFSPPGAGDMVAKVAQPIARTLDAIFDTAIAECSACKNRQAWLNEHLPL